MISIKKLLLKFFVLSLLISSSSFATDYYIKKFELYEHGNLVLKIPNIWLNSVRQSLDKRPPTINLKAKSGQQFDVYLTPMWSYENSPPVSINTLRETVVRTMNKTKFQAVEQNIVINEIAGAQGKGYYFHIEDNTPKPDEYKYMSQGIMKVKNVSVNFTILTNDNQIETTERALKVIQDMVNE